MKTFGENLKNLRNSAGISQQLFAKKLGTTQQRVSEWERGLVEPSLYNIIKILNVLNISFDELTDGL
ncbi:MAG: helix-turn-helix transcriptional regulator [Clostridia bacterium]|nr:helix-turn-helix transcriptional regulator [Clostridia bacterium]